MPPLRGTFVGSVGRLRYIELLPRFVASDVWNLGRHSSLLWDLDCFRYVGLLSPQLVVFACGSWLLMLAELVVASATSDMYSLSLTVRWRARNFTLLSVDCPITKLELALTLTGHNATP